MADRYWVGAVSTDFNDTANWSDVSGGSGGFSIPTSADNTFFDSNSADCLLSSVNRAIGPVDFTGYANTLTVASVIFDIGDCILSPTMTYAATGTGRLRFDFGCTQIQSNGKILEAEVRFRGGSAITLLDNLEISGYLGFLDTSTTLNGNKLIIAGGMSQGASLFGTTVLVFKSGVFQTISTQSFNTDIEFDGDISFAAGYTLRLNSGTHTYLSGTVTFLGSFTLRISGAATLNLDGIEWDAVTFTMSSGTCTLLSNLNANGLVTLGNSSVVITINGFAIKGKAGFTFPITSGVVQGTTELIMTDTGTFDASASITSGGVANPVIIDAPNGDITLGPFTPRVRLSGFVVRNANSITSSELWNLGGGGGGGSYSPIDNILIG